MEQLNLTPEELKKIGFNPLKIDGDEMNKPKTIYKIDFINGYIYCNPDEKVYKWYHKTILGDAANYIHLDITNRPILYTLLSCLNINYELVMV